MTQYTVITGDVIKSRKYSNINSILEKLLTEIEYPDSVITPFKISRGDEIQAVFKGLIPFPVIIRQLRYIFRPLNIRFGIGYGEIINIDEENSWNMNGPAFHNARESIDFMDKNKYFISKFTSKNKIDDAINTILYLIDIFQSEWTDSQWEAIYYYEKLGTYKKAAAELNIAFQNVGKRCKAAKWKEVKYAESSIIRLLRTIE